MCMCVRACDVCVCVCVRESQCACACMCVCMCMCVCVYVCESAYIETWHSSRSRVGLYVCETVDVWVCMCV